MSNKRKFDYMKFTDGSIVFDKAKYTQQEAEQIACNEYNLLGNIETSAAFIKYYVRAPHYIVDEFDGSGCYSAANSTDRGAFAVWVVEKKKV